MNSLSISSALVIAVLFSPAAFAEPMPDVPPAPPPGIALTPGSFAGAGSDVMAPPIDPAAAANPLAAARAYFREQSWKLAAATAAAATTSSMSAAEQHEMAYLEGASLLALRRNAQGEKVLEGLIATGTDDEWVGRAHWVLQPGLLQGRYISPEEDNPLAHLHAADRILSDLHVSDLKNFYLDVIKSSLTTTRFKEEADRNYILSFFNKVIPLLDGDSEGIADVLLKRERALDSLTERKAEERLAGWRGIVSGYPRTRAGARAQQEVARFYLQKRDYLPALYELSLLVNQFPGTEEAKFAEKEIAAIKRPEAQWALPKQFLPGEDVTFEMASRNADKVKFSAIPFSIIDELKRQKTTRLSFKDIPGKPAMEETVPVERKDDHHTTTRTVSLKIKKPGAYVLRADINGKPVNYALLIVSDLALVGNNGGEGYEFWAVHAQTGKPRPGVAITVGHNVGPSEKWFNTNRTEQFRDFDSVQSGSDGFANFKASDDRDRRLMAVAVQGDSVAFLDNINTYGNSIERPHLTGYIYTDRPVYRPAQTVYWRAIVRTRDGGEYKLPTGQKYKAILTDARNESIAEQTNLSLSPAGTLHGEAILPAGVALGSCSIVITDAAGQNHVGGGSFRVEEYKKSEFEVSVEAGSDFARIGQNVTAEVKASYLFGGPVTDASVNYTVRRRPRYRIFWDEMRWYVDDLDLGWFTDPPERPPVLHGSGGTIVAEGKGKLNSKGEFTLTFDSTVPDEEAHSGFEPMDFRSIWPPRVPAWDFQVEVTVTDASRRNIDASQVIPVGLKAYDLAARTSRRIVTPGDNARVELKSLNLAGKPVPTSGTLYVEKLVYNETDKKDDITTVSTQAAVIGSSGSLLVNWRVPADLHGRLRFAYIVDDPFGGKSVAYAQFFSATPDDTDVGVRYQGVEIIADKTQYVVGDTARVMILNELKGTEAWVWIDTGSASLLKQVLPLPHRTNFLSIPITKAYVPNSQLHIVVVRDKRIIQDEVEFIVPPTAQVLNVQVIPGAAKAAPGSTGKVSIKVTDEQGNPVQGEFSLSVFDQAITYIAPDNRRDIRVDLYGMKRPLNSQVSASLLTTLGYDYNVFDDIGRFLEFSPTNLEEEGFGGGGPAMYATDRSMSRGMPPAMRAAPAMADRAMESAAFKSVAAAPMQAMEPPMPAIRSDFRDSMFWSATVQTDATGSATVDVKYPDSLTTWKMVAVGVTPDTRVGNATTETIVTKDILVRLQAPRFFRERDEVAITGNIHNYTDAELPMDVTLRTSGVALENGTTMPLADNPGYRGNTQKITVPAGGEQRVDWRVRVTTVTAGDAVLNLMATSSAGGDAMQTTVPLMPHGIDKFVAWNGTSRDESTTDVVVETSGTARTITRTVSLPAERIRQTSRLDIIVNPSLAASIREALPYMIDYPYGCVEQTMSRFMPAVVAANAFEKLGYPADITLKERLPEVTSDSLQRLKDMQLPSGGWGWWAMDRENLDMTSYVISGLTIARDAGLTIDDAMMDKGLNRLAELRDELTSRILNNTDEPLARPAIYVPGNRSLHELMAAEYALTLNSRSSSATMGLLMTRRGSLGAYGHAMLARTLGKLGRTADADIVFRNMANEAVITPENKTRRWGRLENGWVWYDDAVEATAVALMAYLELHPDDPATDEAMKWLVLNRQGSRWKSTRDTSHAVLALTRYLANRNEAAKPATIRVSAGGKLLKTLEVKPENFWEFDGTITLRGEEIPDANFPVTFEVEGDAKIYYSIFAEYFTLEEGIKGAGNEIYVTRTYEKLHRETTTETVKGQPRQIYKDTWVPLKEGEALVAGDEIRANLSIKSLNDYEYLIFEDPKPAGMEPVDLQSGSRYGDGLCSNMELRDAWVAFFMTNLRQGTHSLTYRMRAEIPGTFHTMPTTGYAMYFPPLRTNSDEALIKIVDETR